MSKTLGPSPPLQWPMPGAMNSRYAALDVGPASDRLQHARVVLGAVERGNLRIAPAVILNQLAAAIDERLQVRIERVDRAGVRIFRARDVRGGVEPLRGPTPDR